MKKIFIITALIWIAFQIVSAQVLLNEIFNNASLPVNWQNDGGWYIQNGGAINTSSTSMLITPSLQIPIIPQNQPILMSCKLNSINGDSSYSIKVSTTGRNSSDFTRQLSIGTLPASNSWVEFQTFTMDLSAFVDQAIYISFQKTSGAYLLLDDVWVGNPTSLITEFPWTENFSSNSLPTSWVDWSNSWLLEGGYTYTTTNNNLLITPQLQLPSTMDNQCMFFTYKSKSSTIEGSSYDILISESGLNPANFTDVYHVTTSSTSFQYRSLDLSAYNGQTIYIAFRNTGGASIYLDDIVVTVPEVITEYPWTETFATSIPIGWKYYEDWNFNSGYARTQGTNDIITPLLYLPTIHNQATLLTYKVMSGYANSSTYYEILVSTTGLNPNDFNNVIYDEVSGSSLQTRSLNLSAYEGQTVYIAFRRASGVFLIIDDIWVGVPEPPQAFTATAGNTQVVLNWTAPVAGHGATISGYKIYRHTEPIYTPSTAYLAQAITSGNTYTWIDAGLSNGTNYYYKIVATYANPTGESYPINASTYPVRPYVWNPPETFIATAGNLQVVLDWETPTEHGATISAYNIYRGTTQNFTPDTPLQTIPNGSFTWTDTGLTNGVNYYYKIVVAYTDPTGDSDPLNASTYPVKPYVWNPPETFTAATGNTQVLLNWTAPETGQGATLSGYKIYRGTTSSFTLGAPAQTIESDNTYTWTDTGLTNGTNYFYKIVATYTDPTGDSNTINAATYPVKPYEHRPPQTFTATAGNELVILNWASPIGHGATVVGYELYRASTSDFIVSPTTLLHTVSSGSTLTWTDAENLTNGSEYYYKIVVNYTEPAGVTDPINATPYPAKPYIWNPPQSVTATDEFAKAILDWEAPVTGHGATLTGYKVYRDTTPDFIISTASLVNEVTSESTLHWENTDLVNGTKYYYQMVAVYENPDGESAPVSTSVQLKVFNPPTELIANGGNAQVGLSWTAPEEHENSATLTGYKIYRDNVMLPEGVIQNPSQLTFADCTVNNNTTYEYYVVAIYTEPEGTSVASNMTSTTPVAAFNPPLSLSASVGFNIVILNWSPPEVDNNSATVTGYIIMRDEAIIAETTEATYTDETVVNGVPYTYSVIASYTSPEGVSLPISLNVQMNIYNAPTGLTVSEGVSLVALYWTAPERNTNPESLTGYKVYKDGLPLAEVTLTTFTDVDLMPGTYIYTVSAVYVGGESTLSEPITAVIYEVQSPENLQAIPGPLTVTLLWQAPTATAGLLHYNVFRKASTGEGFSLLHQTTDLVYVDTMITAGIEYEYYVTAVYPNGESVATDTVQAIAYNLLPPTNVLASITEGASITLSWVPPDVVGLASFKVYRREIATDEFAILNETATGEVCIYTDVNVVAGTTYQYCVTAVYPAGESGQSNIIFVVFYYLMPPANLVADATENMAIALSWEAPVAVGLQGYKVYRKADMEEEFTLLNQTAEVAYEDATATVGVEYEYYVTAVYYAGESGQSNVESASIVAAYNPVRNLVANIGFNSVSLGWEAPEVASNSATLSGYRVMRGEAVLTVLEGTVYTDNTAVNGEAYVYSVIAVYADPAGESVAVTANVQMKVFNAPTELVTDAGNAYVALNWLTPATHEHSATLVGYKVYRDGMILPTDVLDTFYVDEYLINGVEYAYYVVAVYSGPDGVSEPTETVSATPSQPSSNEDDNLMPMVTKLYGNYPNPFNPSTVLRFSLACEDRVVIDIYSIKGQLVRSLVNGVYGAGVHNVVWNGRDELGRSVSSGIYFYRIRTSEYTGVRKMLLLK